MLQLPPESLFRPGPPRGTHVRRAAGFTLPPGVERYAVPGAGAVAVQIAAGDRIEIINDEGGQRCELLAAHADGRL
ncbi:hypothetical protein O4J55_22000, partial [Paracoccus sp. PXZ]